ncbi:SIMPL domain-containing protein [Thetidibacter halocola]|uniref:SIMPL domain-containing protein n=1 Tax=Thetidibacter halocola TaxID=2827239 RepID=A0A8J8B7J4_9RHOB|nr:SIMPL domain-containing protein [Thetidibacter halocola]MBS0125176.1 SIMPL domain-containing protein [Thetidibacter halocola]
MRMLSFCIALALATPLYADEAGRITVTGEGQAFAAPDMATITLGVTERADNARDAMDATSAGVAAILGRLTAMGVEPRDVQTSDLSLGPVWTQHNSSGEAVITGYEASNRLTVRVRNLDSLGGVLDAVLEDGANRFSGLGFGLQDPAPLEDEARRAAVADALARARLYAEAAGVDLGPILSINESGGVRPMPMDAPMFAARAEAVPVAAGETGLSASVTIVFALGTDE